MPFRLKCPTCGRTKSVDPLDAGLRVMCSACGTRYDAPAGGPAPRPPSIELSPGIAPPPIVAATPQNSPSHPWLMAVGIAFLLLVVGGGVLLVRQFGSTRPQSSSAPAPLTRPTSAPAAPRASSRPTAPATQRAIEQVSQEITLAPATAATAAEPTSVPTIVHVAEIAPLEPPPPPPPASQPTEALTLRLRPVRPPVEAVVDTLDERIGQAIQQGTSNLLRQFKAGRLQGQDELSKDTLAGLHALAAYALLQAGAATGDERLGPRSPAVDDILKVLKTFPMDRGPATYSRALRAAALGVYDRGEDRKALRADAQWLITAADGGAYSYETPQRLGSRRGTGWDASWDNSNSQYGALGVWAASEAGAEVPFSYWTEVEQHWLRCQLPTGEWGYTNSGPGQLSMTLAGITTLFVTQDQLGASAAAATASSALGRPPFTPALAKGLKWLETDNNAVELPWRWRTYNLYGLERAALASGFKYFGKHDWYRELAQDALLAQRPDGSWYTGEGGLVPTVDTAFTLLFLSRGRHPIFMNKLRFDGYWANRPRDISNLARYASHSLERQFNWQVVNLTSDWTDWMESPILFIASHEVPAIGAPDVEKLRAFVENGGLLFTHSDGTSAAFNRFVESLCQRLFPTHPLTDLPPTHEIYSTLFKVEPKPVLRGVSNGSRLLLLHSPTDLNRAWQTRDSKGRPNQFQIGLNTFIYAAGKVNFRNKLRTPYVPEPAVTPIGAMTVARLRYPGNWDPEPAAWTRFSRLFLAETSIKLEPTPLDVENLKADAARFAHLTGTAEMRLNAAQLKAIHDFVAGGGVLLIDACGGSSAFAQSIRADVLPRAFPDAALKLLPPDDPILTGTGEGMTRVSPRLRPRAAELLGTLAVPLEILRQEKGALIFSGVDLTTALLGTSSYSVIGCEPESAVPLCRNIVLLALEGRP